MLSSILKIMKKCTLQCSGRKTHAEFVERKRLDRNRLEVAERHGKIPLRPFGEVASGMHLLRIVCNDE